MGYRRGFKSFAESVARAFRGELGLGSAERFDPFTAAAYLGIPILKLSSFRADAPIGFQYFQQDLTAFSAATVFDGYKRAIVHNDFHAAGRQASNIAHELAHALLFHEPGPAIDDRGARLWDQNVEDEAQYLAGVLMLPHDACIAMVFRPASIPEVAREFGVSEQMARYRLNVSGAQKIARRARERRRR